jgi:hypothetical protein
VGQLVHGRRIRRAARVVWSNYREEVRWLNNQQRNKPDQMQACPRRRQPVLRVPNKRARRQISTA